MLRLGLFDDGDAPARGKKSMRERRGGLKKKKCEKKWVALLEGKSHWSQKKGISLVETKKRGNQGG